MILIGWKLFNKTNNPYDNQIGIFEVMESFESHLILYNRDTSAFYKLGWDYVYDWVTYEDDNGITELGKNYDKNDRL